jgi:hypothetical protein
VLQLFSSKKKADKKELAPFVEKTSEFPGTTFGESIYLLRSAPSPDFQTH